MNMEGEKWVQLAYDSDPKKRLRAAEELSKSESPFAMFAMLELLTDKDETVRLYVRKALKQTKPEKYDNNAILSDLLLTEKEKEMKEETDKITNKEKEKKHAMLRKKLEPIIDKLIEAKDPEKRKRAKEKVMPMVEQIIQRWADKEEYLMELFGSSKGTDIQEEVYDEISEIGDEDSRKYLKMISSVEMITQGIPEIGEDESKDDEYIEEIPKESNDNLNYLSEEGEDVKDNPFIEPIDRILYNQAVKIVTMPGITKKVIKEQQTQMKKEIQLKIKEVFGLAMIKTSHRFIEWLDQLEEGMDNVYTKELDVILSEDKIIKPKRGKGKELKRLVVSDGQNEFAVYLWKGRGKGIYEGEKVILENFTVETFPITEETALTEKKTGSAIYVLK